MSVVRVKGSQRNKPVHAYSKFTRGRSGTLCRVLGSQEGIGLSSERQGQLYRRVLWHLVGGSTAREQLRGHPLVSVIFKTTKFSGRFADADGILSSLSAIED